MERRVKNDVRHQVNTGISILRTIFFYPLPLCGFSPPLFLSRRKVHYFSTEKDGWVKNGMKRKWNGGKGRSVDWCSTILFLHTSYFFSFFSSLTSAGHIAIIMNRNGSDAAIEIVWSGLRLPTDNNR